MVYKMFITALCYFLDLLRTKTKSEWKRKATFNLGFYGCTDNILVGYCMVRHFVYIYTNVLSGSCCCRIQRVQTCIQKIVGIFGIGFANRSNMYFMASSYVSISCSIQLSLRAFMDCYLQQMANMVTRYTPMDRAAIFRCVSRTYEMPIIPTNLYVRSAALGIYGTYCCSDLIVSPF